MCARVREHANAIFFGGNDKRVEVESEVVEGEREFELL